MIEHRDINHFHLFCGLGGGAAGFNAASARVGNLHGRFRCLGGIDSDPAAIADFGRLAGVPGTVLDLFDRSQYIAWHGHEPPADWREATPDDIRHAAGNKFRIIPWDQHAGTVIGARGPADGAASVADPRGGSFGGKYAVTRFDAPTGTVISGSTTGQGAFAVADPRTGMASDRDHFRTGGHYGVCPWEDPSGAVTGHAKHDSGRWNVADPRMPDPSDRLVAVIRSLDDTWHRPFTTLELAALQGLVDPDDHMELAGLSDSAWRERIGNAVPKHTATAIAHVIGTTLLLAMTGETFVLGSTPIWVRPFAVALAVDTGVRA